MRNNNFHIVSEGILNEILRKKLLLEALPEYHLNRKTKSHILRKEANKHSVSLEVAGYENHSTIGKKEKAKEFHRCEQDLESAMQWGFQNYDGIVSLDFLEGIGKKIDPDANFQGFRKDRVRVLGATWSPPAPEKLPRELAYFCYSNSCLDNVIEKSLHAHFNIARIHPFMDGNGRTARLVQNIVLEEGGFPPTSIRSSERGEYGQLLDKAIDSYRMTELKMTPGQEMRYTTLLSEFSKNSPNSKKELYLCEQINEFERLKMTREQNELYNFLALKVRDALQKITGKIYQNRNAVNSETN